VIGEKRSSVAATVPIRFWFRRDLELDAELLAWRYQKPQSPGSHPIPIKLRARRILKQSEFYELIPPYNDVHRVRTISSIPSISLHLLANDTGCVVRQKFDPEKGEIEPFRSGWSNAPCPEEVNSWRLAATEVAGL